MIKILWTACITPMDRNNFSCTLCGECCSGSMKVFVNSFDLYKMAQHLKKESSRQLFDEGYVKMDSGQNKMLLPRIRFKEKPFPFCPFLINDFDEDRGLRGLCSLHPHMKPLVCRLAPLSRSLDLHTDKDQLLFTLPHKDCPGIHSDTILDSRDERRIMLDELSYEKRYYTLLSRNAHAPDFLWDFSLSLPFEKILEGWEEEHSEWTDY